MKFTIGADPEVFLQSKEGFKSAARILLGTKYSKETMKCGAGLHWDNVACEFATTVSGTESDFVSSISRPLEEISERMAKKKLKLSTKSYAIFPEDQVSQDGEKQFGCDPDYDAWELKENCAPIPPSETFRSCGGHVHVGYTKGGPKELIDPYGKVKIVKLLDIFLGIPFVLLDRFSGERRKIYGRASCHRPTEYGIEYRVLSNFWIFSEETIRLVYKLVRDALSYIKESDFLIELCGGKEQIIKCINEDNTELSKYIFKKVIYKRMKLDTKKAWNRAVEKLETLHMEYSLHKPKKKEETK